MRSGTIRLMLVVALASTVGLAGCESKDRRWIREGMLMVGLSQDAFRDEWGLPDRTASLTSEEEIRARWGAGRGVTGGGFFKGKRPLDVWIYDRHGVELVFDDGDLVAWKSDKTVEQLRTIPVRGDKDRNPLRLW